MDALRFTFNHWARPLQRPRETSNIPSLRVCVNLFMLMAVFWSCRISQISSLSLFLSIHYLYLSSFSLPILFLFFPILVRRSSLFSLLITTLITLCLSFYFCLPVALLSFPFFLSFFLSLSLSLSLSSYMIKYVYILLKSCTLHRASGGPQVRPVQYGLQAGWAHLARAYALSAVFGEMFEPPRPPW